MFYAVDGLSFRSVLHPLWVTSKGAMIVSETVQGLNISLGDPHVGQSFVDETSKAPTSPIWKGFSSNPSPPHTLCFRTESSVLRLKICAAGDAGTAAEAALANINRLPPGEPQAGALHMIKGPIWSTWARFKMDITQEKVLGFAREIVSKGFPRSVMEIDDKWSQNYGDFLFDPHRFPNPKKMVRELHRMGFKVTVWLVPFVSVSSQAYHYGKPRGYLLSSDGKKRLRGGDPQLVRWWQGTAAVLDLSDHRTTSWVKSRLKALMKTTGIDGFKMDAGEPNFVSFLPKEHPLHTHHLNLFKTKAPDAFTVAWAKLGADLTGLIETRSAYNTQGLGIFVREFDKDSRWGHVNEGKLPPRISMPKERFLTKKRSLHAVITSAILFGLLGYYLVLPDMIGGNAYAEDVMIGGDLPEKELYIRWCLATALLPSMQFSISPWQYDQQTINIALHATELHQRYARLIERLANEAAKPPFLPIIRPIFLHERTDPLALDVSDEFFLGPDVIVAPILDKSRLRRDVYLPRGEWVDFTSKVGDMAEPTTTTTTAPQIMAMAAASSLSSSSSSSSSQAAEEANDRWRLFPSVFGWAVALPFRVAKGALCWLTLGMLFCDRGAPAGDSSSSSSSSSSSRSRKRDGKRMKNKKKQQRIRSHPRVPLVFKGPTVIRGVYRNKHMKQYSNNTNNNIVVH
eukprot:jgi/Bigna1/72625/fgenesh1_pg.20_\